jgi:hypothetical protein
MPGIGRGKPGASRHTGSAAKVIIPITSATDTEPDAPKALRARRRETWSCHLFAAALGDRYLKPTLDVP